MKKAFLVLIMMAVCGNALAAEFLVQAKGHWMDKLVALEVDKMSESEREAYESRAKLGDIVVVKPDGWNWGKEECLPNYIVVKVPDMSYEEAKKYEESLVLDKVVNVTREFAVDENIGEALVRERFVDARAVTLEEKTKTRQAIGVPKSAYDEAKSTGDWSKLGFISEPANITGDTKISGLETKNNFGGAFVSLEGQYQYIEAKGDAYISYIKRKKKYSAITFIPAVKSSTVETTKDQFITGVTEKTGDVSEVVPVSKDYLGYLKRKAEPYLTVAWNYWIKDVLAAQFLHKTVAESGGDYTTLESCMNANEQDLTGDGWFDVEITGAWSSADATSLTIGGYTTTAVDYINIYTSGDSRHSGVWCDTCYTKYQNDYAGGGVSLNDPYVTIDGLQFYNRNTFNYNDAGTMINVNEGGGNNAVPCYIRNNIFKDNRTKTNAQTLISFNTQDWHSNYAFFENNIVYEIGNAVATAVSSSGLSKVYNNTVYGFNVSFGLGTYGGEAKNNISNGSNTDYTGTYTSSNNIDEDGSGEITATLTFKNLVGFDFHLDSTDTAAIDAGADLSATFTTDIDGDTRPTGAGTWDIGADEYRRRMMLIQ